MDGQGRTWLRRVGSKGRPYYQGAFVNGLPHGHGKSVAANGQHYQGEFVNGLPHENDTDADKVDAKIRDNPDHEPAEGKAITHERDGEQISIMKYMATLQEEDPACTHKYEAHSSKCIENDTDADKVEETYADDHKNDDSSGQLQECERCKKIHS